MTSLFAAFIFGVCLNSCDRPHEEEGASTGFNAFSDPQIRKIYEHQDRRDGRALVPFLKAKEPAHRKRAALAFASIQDTLFLPYLLQVAQTDETTEVRRAAVYAIGQMRDSAAAAGLLQCFHHELDYKGKALALEAVGKCADQHALELLVSMRFTDSVLNNGKFAGIYRASLRHVRDRHAFKQCREELSDSNWTQADFYAIHTLWRNRRDPAVQAANDSMFALSVIENSPNLEVAHVAQMWLNSLNGKSNEANHQVSESPYSYARMLKKQRASSLDTDTLIDLLRNESAPAIVRTTAAELLFDAKDVQHNELSYALHSGDMALQSLAANSILSALKNNEETPYSDSIELFLALRDALDLPIQMETYIDLDRLIAQIEGTDYVKPIPDFNHPIDWDEVQNIPADQEVRISTNKGDILIRLFVNDAPGSVWNFLQLVDSGFYDGKYFHRVVPNFVIQGGCPRGDGWGSLNWTQRSEFSNYLRYEAGMVGLASAGNDTEGVQFFITHIPTPHLDGRYSIFGRVIEGMEVVHSIEMGNVIEKIERVEPED